MMLKEIRKTATGVEYWDTQAKCVVVEKESKGKPIVDAVKQFEGIDFEAMQVKELKEFAEQHGIDIPKSMTKKELVIEQIQAVGV